MMPKKSQVKQDTVANTILYRPRFLSEDINTYESTVLGQLEAYIDPKICSSSVRDAVSSIYRQVQKDLEVKADFELRTTAAHSATKKSNG